MTQEDAQLILGALDSLSIALTEYDHQWSDGEKEIYEQSVEILKRLI